MSNNFQSAVTGAINILTEGSGLNDKQKFNVREAEESIKQLFFNAKLKDEKTILHDLKYIVINSKPSKDDIENDYLIIYSLIYPDNKDVFLDELIKYDLFQVDGPDSLWVYLFLTLKNKISVRSGITSGDIDETLLGRSQELQEERIGHEDFELNFEPICILQKGKDCRFTSNERLVYYLVALTGKYQSVGLNTLQPKYEYIFLNAVDSLTFENIFMAMTASHWKHVIIELYRSIENLFSMPLVIDFKQELGYTEPARKLVKLCVDKLRWKRNEKDSLFRLLSLLGKDKIIKSDIVNTTSFSSLSQDSDNFLENFAGALYQIRNQFVHQLECYQEKDIPSEELEKLAIFLIDINLELYQIYDSELVIS